VKDEAPRDCPTCGERHGWTWELVQLPHNPERDLDWAHCRCGWSGGGDDYVALDVLVEEHRREHDGEGVEMWQRRIAR
jgi:C4-type Zn-finger protein